MFEDRNESLASKIINEIDKWNDWLAFRYFMTHFKETKFETIVIIFMKENLSIHLSSSCEHGRVYLWIYKLFSFMENYRKEWY